MTDIHPVLYLVVIDVGMPWKTSTDIVHDYLLAFRRCTQYKLMYGDLCALHKLQGDGYDCLLTVWDGQGPTPESIVHGFAAQKIICVSKATVCR